METERFDLFHQYFLAVGHGLMPARLAQSMRATHYGSGMRDLRFYAGGRQVGCLTTF